MGKKVTPRVIRKEIKQVGEGRWETACVAQKCVIALVGTRLGLDGHRGACKWLR